MTGSVVEFVSAALVERPVRQKGLIGHALAGVLKSNAEVRGLGLQRCRQPTLLDHAPDEPVQMWLVNVNLTTIDRIHHVRPHIHAEHAIAAVGENAGGGKTDIAESNHADR